MVAVMKIKSGKFYKTRDGQKVGPMRKYKFKDKSPDKAFIVEVRDGRLWGVNGTYSPGSAVMDLIAEWDDTPDLTAITTPFGLLDDATREALNAHGGPYQAWDPSYVHQWYIVTDAPRWMEHIIYRVKPSPPKPREWWLNPEGRGVMAYDEAEMPAPWVRVREVTD